MKRDYARTFLVEFAILFAMMATYRFAAAYWSVDGFAEYSLARRSVGLVQLPLAVGMGIAIPRFVAIALANGSEQDAARCFLAGCVIGLGPTLILLALLNLVAPFTAGLLLGDRALAPLVFPLSLVVLGLNLHGMAYGYFRGRLAMGPANALQFVIKGLAPVLPFAIPGLDVSRLLLVVGAAACLVGGVSVLALARRAWALSGPPRINGRTLGEMFAFGGPRVPGEVALSALLALPGIVIAHRAGVRDGGFLAFGVSLLTMLGACFAPIGLIMLPRASGLAARGDREALGRMVWRVFGYSLAVASIGCAAFALAAHALIRLFLGPEYADAADTARLVLAGGVPYVAYVVLRSVLDALKTAPLNTRNLVLALAGLALGCATVTTATQVALVLAGALACLGVLTFRDARVALRDVSAVTGQARDA